MRLRENTTAKAASPYRKDIEAALTCRRLDTALFDAF